MRILLSTLSAFLISLPVFSQERARVVPPNGEGATDDGMAISRFNLGGITGAELGLDPAWMARYYVGFRVADIIYAAPLTTAVTRGSDGVIRVSVNGLALIPASLLLVNRAYLPALVVMLPQLLLNPTLDQPIIGRTLSATLSGRTDWYAFSKDSKVYMEGSAGLRLRLGKLVLEGRLLLPILQGYLESRDPMAGVGIYYGGGR